MILEAHAKVNLSLDITGRRPNGYHELDMIMQELGLHDDIFMEMLPAPGISLEAEDCRSGLGLKQEDGNSRSGFATVPENGLSRNSCDLSGMPEQDNGPASDNGSWIPADRRNLMYRAAELMTERYGIEGGVSMKLKKRIPAAAGLAGGSADAAAVIKGMNVLFGLGLTQEELQKTGAELGADIPYCILGGTARAQGIGELLTPVRTAVSLHVLLVKPCEGCSTPEVYRAYDALTEIHSQDLQHDIVHPSAEAVAAALRSGDREALYRSVGNVLEYAVIPTLPLISRIKADMLAFGARCSCMSGSGSTVFGLFEDPAVLRAAALAFRRADYAAALSDIIETECTAEK